MIPDPALLAGLKSAAATLAAAGALVWAQVSWPSLDAIGSVSLVGFLALMVGRYTFHQLESYRSDLNAARERIDQLQEDLHRLGKAKAQIEAQNRDLENYCSRLQLWVHSAWGDTPPTDMPERPDLGP